MYAIDTEFKSVIGITHLFNMAEWKMHKGAPQSAEKCYVYHVEFYEIYKRRIFFEVTLSAMFVI